MRFRLHLSLGFAITTFLSTVYSERAPAIQETSKPQMCCPIVELRQYTLHPGKRDVFVELFDRELVETQKAVGMSIIGQFRDLDKPDRFVWLRGFPDKCEFRSSRQQMITGKTPGEFASEMQAMQTLFTTTRMSCLYNPRQRLSLDPSSFLTYIKKETYEDEQIEAVQPDGSGLRHRYSVLHAKTGL